MKSAKNQCTVVTRALRLLDPGRARRRKRRLVLGCSRSLRRLFCGLACRPCTRADGSENAIAVETRTAIILRDMKNPPGAKPDRNNTILTRQLCDMFAKNARRRAPARRKCQCLQTPRSRCETALQENHRQNIPASVACVSVAYPPRISRGTASPMRPGLRAGVQAAAPGGLDVLTDMVAQAVAFARRLRPRTLEVVGLVEPVDFPSRLEILQRASQDGARPPLDARLEAGKRRPAEIVILVGCAARVRQEGFGPTVRPAQLVVALAAV